MKESVKKRYYNLVNFIKELVLKIESNNCQIEFYWIKSHIGSYGNEAADTLAKYHLCKNNKGKFKGGKMLTKDQRTIFNMEINEFKQFKLDKNIS